MEVSLYKVAKFNEEKRSTKEVIFMSVLSHEAIQNRRNYLIDQLLSVGIYKKENVQLYELCLSDLEREYKLFKEGETRSEKENIKTISD